MLRMCQEEDIPVLNLKTLLTQIYSEEGGLTIYDGEAQPAWDKTTYDKFHLPLKGADNSVTVTAYVDKTTHNGRWLQEESTLAKDPKIIINVPKGEEPATFADSDFTLAGCKGKVFVRDPEQMVRLFRP
jgi:hypothetical protein